jgi:hypothetical protein
MSKSKNGEVTSSLDVASPVLVEAGRALIGKGTELETAWFQDSATMLDAKKISVRGVQLSMQGALAGFGADVKFPSLTETMVQYFVKAQFLMALDGWKGSPVEAIRIIQSGKRSEAFKDSREFDGALATAKTAKAIVAKAKQPKRASKVAPKVEGATVTTLEGEKVQTFSEAIIELKKVALSRTSHLITPEAMADARFIIAIINKQIKAQESADAKQVIQAVA